MKPVHRPLQNEVPGPPAMRGLVVDRPLGAAVTGYKTLPVPTQTILLAEDDDDLREVVTYFLETMGFSVIACSNAELASEAFRSGLAIDILVTDLQMPGRSGMELARELTKIRANLPVLIVSGSILSNKLLEEIESRRWVYVSKPCELTSLLSPIQVLLKAGQKVTKSIKMEHASMLNDEELVIDLSDGTTVEVNAEQLLSLHPDKIGRKKMPARIKGNPKLSAPTS